MPLDIEKMLVLSTVHVPADVRAVHHGDPLPWSAGMWRDEGWLVHCPDRGDGCCGDDVPDWLVALMDFALRQDCCWLLFDRDGDEIAGFPVFEDPAPLPYPA